MNHEILKRVIFDQIDVIKNAKIIERDYKFDLQMNYILVGLRRAGKSTLLYSIARKLIDDGADWRQIIYVNFEDDRILGFTKDDFDDIIETAHELNNTDNIYYFFDEIQNIDGWEHFSRRMADHKKRVFITGSNAKMLSHEMESILGGRYLSKIIMPFSFKEILNYNRVDHDEMALLTTAKIGSIRRVCESYLKDGGLPEVQNLYLKREYVKSVFEKIILGDIGEREQIKNKIALRLMIKKIAETLMHEISFNTLAGNIKATGVKCSTDIMINYESYAENAYLLFRTKNLISKFGEKEGTPRFYFTDNGFLSLFLVDKKPALLENIVAVHLLRQFGNDIYYIKSSKSGIDIDFYIPEEKLAVQVTYSLSDARNRELKILKALVVKYPDSANRLIVVTHEEEEIIDIEDRHIEVMPLHKFLLTISNGDVK